MRRTHISRQLGDKKTEQIEYPRKRTRAMIKCTNKGISEVKHLKDRQDFFTRSQAITGTCLNTIGRIGYAGVEPKSSGVGIRVEECVKVEVLQNVWIFQCAEVKVECGSL